MLPCCTSWAAANSESPQKPEALPMRRVFFFMNVSGLIGGAGSARGGGNTARPEHAPDTLGGGADCAIGIQELPLGKCRRAANAHHIAARLETIAHGGVEEGDVEVDRELAQLEGVNVGRLGHGQQRGDDGPAKRAVKHIGDDAAIEHGVRTAAAALGGKGFRQSYNSSVNSCFFNFKPFRLL